MVYKTVSVKKRIRCKCGLTAKVVLSNSEYMCISCAWPLIKGET